MKSVFYFKFRWLIACLFIAFAFVLVLHYYQPPKSNPSTTDSSETVQPDFISSSILPFSANGQICLDIDANGGPLGAKKKFGNPDYVYCYVKFENSPSRQQIRLLWIHENEIVHEIPEWINSGNDVMWSKFDFPSNKAGEWAAQIIAQNGIEICRIPFSIKG